MAERLTATRRRALRQEAAGWDELDDDDFARLFEQGRPVRVAFGVRCRKP